MNWSSLKLRGSVHQRDMNEKSEKANHRMGEEIPNAYIPKESYHRYSKNFKSRQKTLIPQVPVAIWKIVPLQELLGKYKLKPKCDITISQHLYNWQGWGATRLSYTSCGHVTASISLENCSIFSLKMNYNCSQPANSSARYMCKKNAATQAPSDMYRNAHRNIIHNSSQVETTHSSGEWMNHGIQNGIICSNHCYTQLLGWL